MVTEYTYTNIRRILDEIHRHPLLSSVTLEQVVSYIITFMGLFGMPKIYQDKEEILNIKDFRAILPCDLVSIIQVKDCKTGVCLRAMTDNFMPREYSDRHIGYNVPQEISFKTQGQVIYTSFKEGDINIP